MCGSRTPGRVGGVSRVRGSALERFPLNIDETTHYTGTATTTVDSTTLLPLATPKVEPLSLSRHVKVIDGDYGQAVVRETITIKAGTTTSVEKYQYVMDRRSMKFVKDPRQFAFGDPTATIHAARPTGSTSPWARTRTASI